MMSVMMIVLAWCVRVWNEDKGREVGPSSAEGFVDVTMSMIVMPQVTSDKE